MNKRDKKPEAVVPPQEEAINAYLKIVKYAMTHIYHDDRNLNLHNTIVMYVRRLPLETLVATIGLSTDEITVLIDTDLGEQE